MTDYVKILSRAVAEKPSYEERRGVYERARQALVAQLRDLDPPLPESDITKQRLALETAIREVETLASGGTLSADAASAAPAALLEPRASETGSQAVESAMIDKPTAAPQAETPETPETPRAATPADSPKPVAVPVVAVPSAVKPVSVGEPALTRVSTYPASSRREIRRPSILTLIIAVIILVALGGTIAGVLMFKGMNNQQETTAASPKISDRVAQDESLAGKGAAVAQSAYLVEENVEAPKGVETFRGKVTWRIDTQSNPQGEGPEKIIRGLVEVADRGMKMLFTVRRNTDAALPASHTIELLFDVAPDFVHGAVDSIAGIRMKPSEQANGLPLASAAVRITTGYFLVALSAGADDTNTVLLRDRPWMDVLLIYRNGRRAVLTVEKGVAGENAFNDAFQSWGVKPQQ